MYPNHPGSSNDQGSGTICVDEQDDIVMKVEIHSRLKGENIDYTRALTKIDFAEPDPSIMQIPPDVKMVNTSATK